MTNQSPLPCPFTVLIDTSEQHPWTFRGLSANSSKVPGSNPPVYENRPLVIACRAANLMTGDYTIEGMQNYITIERKSLSDAFSTFTHDRDRWERELDRMRSIASCHVVIEGDWEAISAGPVKLGGANIGKAVMRSIFAWSIRYPHVHWWAMPTREMAEATAFRLLEKFWEDDLWQRKQLAKLSIESELQGTSRRSRGKCTRETSSLFPQ